jgi:hypothetical protein
MGALFCGLPSHAVDARGRSPKGRGKRSIRAATKRTEARDLLAPIYGWFTEGFDTPVLQEAKTLPDELM